MMMHLHGGDWKFIQNALKTMGAPTNANELGLDPEDIIDGLSIAHEIRNERYTILGDRGLSRSAAKNLAIKTEVIDQDY
jgi:glycerol-1-phosphate dehydrogenase [NAD(P)+]